MALPYISAIGNLKQILHPEKNQEVVVVSINSPSMDSNTRLSNNSEYYQVSHHQR